MSQEACTHDWSDVRHLVPSGVTDICFKCGAEKRYSEPLLEKIDKNIKAMRDMSTNKPNHVCEKCGAVQPPMSPQTFGVCQKCGASFSYR